jgi:hypothetical protein
MSNKDTFDMGAVTDEDPVTDMGVPVPKEPRAKRARKDKGAISDTVPAATKEPKIPVTGEYGKRGLPTFVVSLTEDAVFEGDAAKHHQRQVVYEVLTALGGSVEVGDIITTIESDNALLQRMNTTQSVMRCVVYQVNELVKHNIVTTSKDEDKAARAEAKAAKEAEKAARAELKATAKAKEAETADQ